MNCFSLGAHHSLKTNFLSYTSIQQCVVRWFFIISFSFWPFEISDFGILFNLLLNVSGPGWCICWSRTAGCIWYDFFFLFVSWYLLFPCWPIILASFDAHVNLEVCFYFSLFFCLHPKGSVQEPFHYLLIPWYAPLHLIEDLNICIWGFNLRLPDKIMHLLLGCMQIETGQRRPFPLSINTMTHCC